MCIRDRGNFEIMAAVMAGGMIPPLAIALSTTLFKNRWTKDEQNSGLVNYVMGLAFISEGAIPFAAKDPLRVIPSCIAGSAVAGGLSMFFGCSLRAPHGGISVSYTHLDVYKRQGWVWESFICPVITGGKIKNSGFLNGPIVPIYGVGAVSYIHLMFLFIESVSSFLKYIVDL